MRFPIPLLILLTIFVVSCEPDADTELPIATIDLPQSNDAVLTADGLRLVASFLDNTGLLQYKLVIDGIDELNDVGADSTLSLIYIEGIPNEEKAFYLDELVGLDENTFNGQMRGILSCIDIEGNESAKDTVDFEIVNSIDSDSPVFTTTGPIAGDTLGFGEGFSVGGDVSDTQSLIYSDIYIGRSDSPDTILSFQFTVIQNNAVDYGGIGWYFQVDSAWSQGDYQMHITAWDNYSGVSSTIPFYVSY